MKIENVLNDTSENHMMPFLWMHGEEESVIRKYVQEIARTGIGSICIESRPHPAFLKEQWWQDVAIIIDECKKQRMTIWILDDAHFPTGFAAGEMVHHPELKKKFLRIIQMDFVGPQQQAGILLEWTKQSGRPNILNAINTKAESLKPTILSIVAAKKTGYEEIDSSTLIDLKEFIVGDTLYWDIPEGEWSFFVLLETYDGGEEATKDYLNPLVREATEVLLDAVYESHYQHFKEEFGNTILGFFSDEPRFGNVKGPDAIVGKLEMDYPWSDSLLEMLSDKMKLSIPEVTRRLPLLFCGTGPVADEIRYEYMDLVTNLYRENFSKVIGHWCEVHQVEYIGHVIEDNNAHSRLGYGAGHFFKSMAGQHMSGIDIVLHQLMPGQNNGKFKAMTTTGWDGEFFHYGLAKMGSSLGYLDENKQGRTMCEVFGAYGWSEGLSLMKYIADHMLASGVNYFVPHAFSMKKYPDPDCPPHFYAHGENPQFPYMHHLVHYMNRIASLISNGYHKAEVAVLYHGEAEWAGESMLTQKPMRALIENQIEFDVIPLEYITQAKLARGHFQINSQSYQTLVIPYSRKIPKQLMETIDRLLENDVSVILIDALPDSYVAGDFSLKDKEMLAKAEVCSLENLSQKIQPTVARLQLTKEAKDLRYFHYQQADFDVVLLFNQSQYKKIDTQIQVPKDMVIQEYNAFDNTVTTFPVERSYHLQLASCEMKVLFYTKQSLSASLPAKKQTKSIRLNKWNIDFTSATESKNYPSLKADELPMLGSRDDYENFVGTVCYSTKLPDDFRQGTLEIENANEIVEVFINGKSIGTKISHPYHFDLGSRLEAKETELAIHVINNLGRKQRDYLSQFVLFEPIGIYGQVTLNYEEDV